MWPKDNLIALAVCVTIVAVASASGQARAESPTAEAIAASMEQARAANKAQLRPYVVTRVYKLFGQEESDEKSEVTAEVTFTPPHQKEYTIVESTGSSLGLRIVRKMLDGETQIVRDYGATDLSLDNYEFRLLGEEPVAGRRCYIVELSPRRKEKKLLRGNMWIDADTYLLRRVEAEPAKDPSFWLTNVRLAFAYGDVEGMWLQISSKFTTNVRIFGQYTIISHDLSYQTADQTSADVEGSIAARGGQIDGRQEPERARERKVK